MWSLELIDLTILIQNIILDLSFIHIWEMYSSKYTYSVFRFHPLMKQYTLFNDVFSEPIFKYLQIDHSTLCYHIVCATPSYTYFGVSVRLSVRPSVCSRLTFYWKELIGLKIFAFFPSS